MNIRKIKKRNIALVLLAMELMSLPAAAQIIDKVVLSVGQKAISVELETETGVSQFMVTSNAPFAIIAENVMGDIDINLHTNGTINGKRFGTNAQMPGAAQSCATALSPAPQAIYVAERKTAATKGPILSQAILVSVVHGGENANVRIVTEKEGESFSRAPACVNAST